MRKNENQKPSLDPSIEKYYSLGNEKDRLNDKHLEKDRTRMILKKNMPPPPAVVLDVGGASGVYSFPLASMGYEVHLLDPVALHIEQAQKYEKESSIKLASCSTGDARKIAKEDNFADVVLFLGPLYHLIDQSDRLLALDEAYRVLKPGGILFAAAISRFASFMDSMYKGVTYSKFEVIKNEFETGVHRKVKEEFNFGYLHTAPELKREIQKSGLENVSILAIEGPVWHPEAIKNLQQDQTNWKRLLSLFEQIEAEETIIGASAHMMAVARKPYH